MNDDFLLQDRLQKIKDTVEQYGEDRFYISFSGGKDSTVLSSLFDIFNPLVMCTDEWMEWVIDTYHIEICDLYKPPYNFHRTGCKGCPFAIDLQHNLEMLQEFSPAERNQCELIWKPVYDEYRRLHYRLKDRE